MDPIDHTETLNKAHEIQEIAQLMLKRLDENATTPAKRDTYEKIKAVVELQSSAIAKLVEHNIQLTEEIEKAVTQLEEKHKD